MSSPKIPPLWNDYRIFDAHSHIGDFYDIGASFSVTELKDYMQKYNVSYAAISGVSKNWKQDNDQVADAIKKIPGKIVGLAHIDPTVGKAALDEIDRCVSLGFKGLKLHPHYDAYMVYDPDLVFPVLERASKHKLPVLFHTGTPPMVTPIHIGLLAQHFQDIPLICGHMGFGDCSYEAPVAGKMSDNVYMDTTAASVHTIIEKTIKTLGAEKMLWGTDQPYLSFEGEFFKLLSLRISEDDRKKILFDNPLRVYGIKK